MSLILVGDIGGTNIRYRLIQSTESSDHLIKSQIFPADPYKSNIILSIQEILSGESIPEIAVLGFPGIISSNRVIASYQYCSGFEASMITEQIGIQNYALP